MTACVAGQDSEGHATPHRCNLGVSPRSAASMLIQISVQRGVFLLRVPLAARPVFSRAELPEWGNRPGACRLRRTVVTITAANFVPGPPLNAEEMDRRGLLPNGPLGMHHARCRGRKTHAVDQPIRVSGDAPQALRFARRSRAELQHDAGSDIFGARRGGLVIDEKLVAICPCRGR